MPKCHLDQIQGILGNTNPIQKSALTHLFGLSSAFQSHVPVAPMTTGKMHVRAKLCPVT